MRVPPPPPRFAPAEWLLACVVSWTLAVAIAAFGLLLISPLFGTEAIGPVQRTVGFGFVAAAAALFMATPIKAWRCTGHRVFAILSVGCACLAVGSSLWVVIVSVV